MISNYFISDSCFEKFYFTPHLNISDGNIYLLWSVLPAVKSLVLLQSWHSINQSNFLAKRVHDAFFTLQKLLNDVELIGPMKGVAIAKCDNDLGEVSKQSNTERQNELLRCAFCLHILPIILLVFSCQWWQRWLQWIPWQCYLLFLGFRVRNAWSAYKQSMPVPSRLIPKLKLTVQSKWKLIIVIWWTK